MSSLLILGQRIAVISGAWAFVSLALLAILGCPGLEYFFVLSLIGFLLIVILLCPFMSRPGWRARVNTAVLVGVLIFSLIAVGKVLALLQIKLL